MNNTYTLMAGSSPLVAAAIHDGHQVRPEIEGLFHLSEEERLREEDPFTAYWVDFTDNQIIVEHSRFELDVNRPREKAVYQKPEDAWGLKTWKQKLAPDVVQASLQLYDQFYKDLREYFDELFKKHDKLVVYDIHSYNYRRESRNEEADELENPEINIGTKNLDRKLWGTVVDTMMENFRSFDYNGHSLDVRENIKFKGGYFGEWLCREYDRKICPISIEFKKFFMDEWTGLPFIKDLALIRQLLQSSVNPVKEAMQQIKV